MNTAKELINEIAFEIVRSDNAPSPWGTPSKVYATTLTRNGFSFTIPYYTGLGIDRTISDFEILETLFNDASYVTDYEETPEDFFAMCEEMGDTPSLQLWNSFHEIFSNTRNLENLLGGKENFEIVATYYNEGEF